MLQDFTQAQRDAMLARIEKSEGFRSGTVERQARDGGIFSSDGAVIPLKGGNVPVTMPREFTDNMVQIKSLLDQVKVSSTKSNMTSITEKIKAVVSSATGGTGSQELTQAFDQMLDELRRQGSLVESVLRAQENTVSVSQKILQYSM
jgi:hypothetical protein